MSDLKSTESVSNCDDFYSKYTLGKRLGEGMSSVVYECLPIEHSRNNLKLAVKIVDLLKSGVTPEETLRQEARREIDLLEIMSGHPCIIDIITSMETIANIFIITDLCEDGDLYDYMSEHITLQTRTTVKIMNQLISALFSIHSRFIAHRDIKMENILITNRYDLKIKLADFGLAVRVVHDKEITEIVGTPSYYAPELIKTAKGLSIGYGRQVDIWACGVVMYSLMLGRTPFNHRQPTRMYRAIMKGSYDKNDKLWKDMKPKMKMMIENMLEIDPATRISAKELKKMLSCRSLIFSPFPSLQAAEKKSRHLSFFAVSIAVRACIRLYQSLNVNVSMLKEAPFSFRFSREILTSMALEIYGHWTKKGDERGGLYTELMQGFTQTSAEKMEVASRPSIDLIPESENIDNSFVSSCVSSYSENG